MVMKNPMGTSSEGRRGKEEDTRKREQQREEGREGDREPT